MNRVDHLLSRIIGQSKTTDAQVSKNVESETGVIIFVSKSFCQYGEFYREAIETEIATMPVRVPVNPQSGEDFPLAIPAFDDTRVDFAQVVLYSPAYNPGKRSLFKMGVCFLLGHFGSFLVTDWGLPGPSISLFG